ncbi:hypothetical protein DPM33_01940 [Mesorhizobium hawassense]|uniref:Propionyl-coenzyme A carboxylase alpha polypeptide n=1 Tax=Mesorhizobium hawassense TaxID=1209954 RepID=A0A330HXV7_9HYPH|nr:hypothetical protein DPM33_01940 [Mesorhizobium hawassense]
MASRSAIPRSFSGPKLGAAPHLPAGIFSPYSDGEKGRCCRRFRQSPTLQEKRRRSKQPLLPVTIRGEVPGRAMRGSADVHAIGPAEIKALRGPKTNSTLPNSTSLLFSERK